MIIPCIDLMGGKVVQLVQGQRKALEGAPPLEMLELFAGFSEIQVIDLDAAMGTGDNTVIIEQLCARARCRVGGGIRSAERAAELVDLGAHRVIVGTAAFTPERARIVDAVDIENIVIALDSKNGKVVVKGWKESTAFTAVEVVGGLAASCGGFLCTYVDKEGMMEGTDLEWFAQLRATTTHEITAAGGITTLDDIKTLKSMNIHSAVGMALYTGRLSLDDLQNLN
jgi:phosphoribosylformimino-5-aminoimidazole carboxamide ribotide isomerase